MSHAPHASKRPLSPHLQVYRFTPTMAASIVHRITGAGLYFGALVLAWWLLAAASGPEYFDMVNGFLGSFIGRVVLFGFTLALMQHMLGGIRHLIWDTGALMEKHMATRLALMNFGLGLVLTILAWALAYAVRGGF